jgi:hypothetical protein
VALEFTAFIFGETSSSLAVPIKLYADESERNMSIAPLIDPLGSVLLVLGVTSSATEVAESLEKLGNQDLGSDSAEQATKRIAKAITGRLVLDLVFIFCNVLFFTCLFERSNAMGYTCKIYEQKNFQGQTIHTLRFTTMRETKLQEFANKDSVVEQAKIFRHVMWPYKTHLTFTTCDHLISIQHLSLAR